MEELDKEIAELRRRLEALEAKKASEVVAGRPEAVTAAPRLSSDKPASGHNLLYIAGAIFAGLILLAMCSSSLRQTPAPTAAPANPPAPATDIGASPPAAPTPDAAPAAGTSWTYSDETDSMTDKVTRTACTTSTNMVHLDAPYGPVDARLCVRKSPKFGLDVFVALNGDGQILCQSYEDCTLHVRYDSHPRQAISGIGASDGSSNVVFLRGEPRIIDQLKHTDVFRVELEFYQAGVQTLDFNTAGLEWGSAGVKAPSGK